MTLDLDQVPSADEMPANAQPSRVWVPFEGWSRRRILAAIGGAAVASGMGVLGLFPWAKPRAAFAGAYQSWGDCHGYWSNNTVTCVPTSAYYNSQNCSGSWHRNDGGSGTCYNFRFIHYPDTCGGNNAWKWGGSGARGNHRKCSDGHYEYHDCGGGNFSSFSICRTAIP
jgi:hypothetical protein